MNTKAVCQKLSVTPKMLRIYEEQGLICPERKANNYREYTEENLVQIETIAILRHLGFSILEIKNILAFEKTNIEHLDMFYLQYKAVDAKIKDLQKTKNELRDAINTLVSSSDRESFSEIILAEREKKNLNINYEALMTDWNFDEMASDFINTYLKEDMPYYHTIRRMQEIIGQLKGRSFIDVGCGTCNLWQESAPDTDLLAVDLSLSMLLESRKKVPWAKIRLDDIISLVPEEYDRFDVVVSTFTLHHISRKDQFKALNNMLQLAKEDGMILIAERCFESEADQLAKKKKLLESHDETELAQLNSENYIYADELTGYLHLKKYRVDIEHTDENMAIYKITKQ